MTRCLELAAWEGPGTGARTRMCARRLAVIATATLLGALTALAGLAAGARAVSAAVNVFPVPGSRLATPQT